MIKVTGVTVRYKPPESDSGSEFTAGEWSDTDVSSYYAGSETDTKGEAKCIYKPAKTRAWELPEWSCLEQVSNNNVGYVPNMQVWGLQMEDHREEAYQAALQLRRPGGTALKRMLGASGGGQMSLDASAEIRAAVLGFTMKVIDVATLFTENQKRKTVSTKDVRHAQSHLIATWGLPLSGCTAVLDTEPQSAYTPMYMYVCNCVLNLYIVRHQIIDWHDDYDWSFF